MFNTAKKITRLGQWTGRKRSSRSDEPLLRRVGHRDVLLRLGVVCATTIAVTLLGVGWGPVFLYRAGQIYPYDIKARVDFQIVNEVDWTKPEAEREHSSTLEKHSRGAVLVPAGHPVQDRHLELLQDE